MVPEEELLLELDELLDDGFVLPVELLELDELELELEELELDDGFTSLGLEEPPLPHAARVVVSSAANNDLVSADRIIAISPPG